MYAYQIEYVSQTPGFWSKVNFSHKVRYQIKAGVLIFLWRYYTGVDSTSLPSTNGGKLSKVESLMDFGRWWSLYLRYVPVRYILLATKLVRCSILCMYIMLQAKNYWDICQQIQPTMTLTPSTRAAADAPVRWPLAVVLNNRAPQRSSRHAWPSMNGLTVALGRLWALLQRHSCSRRHVTHHARIKLLLPPRSSDRHDKTFDMCVSLSSFKRLPAGRLNRSTDQKRGGKPLRRRCLWDIDMQQHYLGCYVK